VTDPKSTATKGEETSVTAATVALGLGYPANRIETTPTPTGWLVPNVSRETLSAAEPSKTSGKNV
jgi:hypothetical protein